MVCTILACKKESDLEERETYPGYFEGMEETHEVLASCSSVHVYVKLSDTSVVFFGLNDSQLDIGLEGSTFFVADLVDWNAVQYYEWTPHLDSLAPNFCDDIAYVNTSKVNQWNLTSGTIIVAVSKVVEEREFMESFDVSIQLSDALFDRTMNGLINISIENIIVRDAHVGWLPG